MRLTVTLSIIALLAVIFPTKGNAFNEPVGWANCTSINSADDYHLTGGGEGSLIVIRSNGADMREEILNAIKTHDVIIFDGSKGDFELSSYISLQNLSGKTLSGINGARLRSKFTVTQDIRDLLDKLNVKSLSGHAEDNLGGTLSNGVFVAEQCEMTIRQALIDYFGDQKEPYRYSGIFFLGGCSNIIISNLEFEGPGSIDVGGADLVTLYGSDHIWIDHCRFIDGMDGNLDIVNSSDFVTVSDTHFRYTDKAYNHPLSNLTTAAAITDGSPQKNNITWIRCFWDEGCTGRMPRTDRGIQHLLNCYWDCTKGTCIDALEGAKVLIESSYFTNKVGKALAVRDESVEYEWKGSIWQWKSSPQSNANVNVPYSYTVDAVTNVTAMVKQAGPSNDNSYSRELSSSPTVIDFGNVYQNYQVDNRFTLTAFGDKTPSSVTLTAPEGVLLSTSPGGEYSTSVSIKATDDNLLQGDIYIKALFNGTENMDLSVHISSETQAFEIPIKAKVVKLEGERNEVTLLWPLDKGVSNSAEPVSTFPGALSEAKFSTGEKLYCHSNRKIGDKYFTYFNPTEYIDKIKDEECCLTFDISSAQGYIFVPRKLTFNTARIGTDMCYIDVESIRETGFKQQLLTAFQPIRSSNSPYYSEVELPLNNVGVGDSLRIKIYLYYMSENKQLALSDLKIEGDTYLAESAVESLNMDKSEVQTEYYDLGGHKIEKPLYGRFYVKVTPEGGKLVLFRD